MIVMSNTQASNTQATATEVEDRSFELNLLSLSFTIMSICFVSQSAKGLGPVPGSLDWNNWA